MKARSKRFRKRETLKAAAKPAAASKPRRKGKRASKGKACVAEDLPWPEDVAADIALATSKTPEAKAKKAPKTKKGGDDSKAPVPKPAVKKPRSKMEKPAATSRRSNLRTATDPLLVDELLTMLWDYAWIDYELTGLGIHEQIYPMLRLNIYWSRDHIGIHDKVKGKDVVNFTTPTATIITHLHLANLVVYASFAVLAFDHMCMHDYITMHVCYMFNLRQSR